jgi:hypothetical protein
MEKAQFHWLSCIAAGRGGKTCRVDAVHLGNFNRSLTTFAYLASRRELGRGDGKER